MVNPLNNHSEGDSEDEDLTEGSLVNSPRNTIRRTPSLIPTSSMKRTLLSASSVEEGDGSKVEISNPALFSKPFQSYSHSIKYTYYSSKNDLRQAWTLEGLANPEKEKDWTSLLNSSDEAGSSDVFWLDLVAPSVDDLNDLSKIFSLHPLTTEDIQMADNREKCEIFEHYLFLCVQTCDQKFLASASSVGSTTRRSSIDSGNSALMGPATIYILMFAHCILTVHHQPVPHIRRVIRRLYGLRMTPQIGLTPDWVLYSLLDDCVDEFFPQMSSLEAEVDTIDELVLFLSHTEQADMLRRIGRARKRTTHLLRLLKPKTEILKSLTKRCPDRLAQHTLLYLRDVSDHVLTSLQNLDQYGETLNRSHSNYLAQISIELNEQSNRMNVVMKKLTAAAALVLPLSLISGIWGMNVPVPGQLGIEHWWQYGPFFVIVSGMAILMVLMYIIGHRNDWW